MAQLVDPLTRLRRATRRRNQADLDWKIAIVNARKQGETLRAIGDAAGVSHVRVLQLLRD